MTDIRELSSRQVQRMLDDTYRQAYAAPANSIYDCVECDKPIGIQRKAAVPWATRCVDCQSHYERKR